MVVINSGDQLPDLFLVLLLRALWRYRSELAPVATMAVLAIAAAIVHTIWPHWWPYVLAAAVAAASVALLSGRRFGLSWLPERLYAATVTLAAGSWLAAGIASSPIHPPLLNVLFIGGVVLAVPWWAHRRRRARVKVERTLAAWPEIAQSVQLAGSRVQSAMVDVWGWRARFTLARGHTIGDVLSKIPAIESALGTFRGAVRVYPTPDDRANRFELRVLNVDPHANAITWPGPSVSTITQPIDLGPFEDAAPARVLMLRRHGLFGGATGSGKSGGINVLIGNLAACRDVVIWGIDLKRGMELGPWGSCLDRLATTAEQGQVLLRDAVAVLEARAAQLANAGRRVWEPTPAMPALVIIIDEYAELAEEAPDAASDADSIARRGRAVAVTLIAATQRPTQKAMGHGAVRSQMDVRVCFRVRERRDVDLILGQGMREAGWHAHTLNAPGKFLISAPEHDTPRRARAYLLTDEAVTQTARRYAHARPQLDEPSRRAIDTVHQTPTLTQARQAPKPSRDRSPTSPELAHDNVPEPDAVLWAALSNAPDEGIPIPHLMIATGMGRRWVYYRLNELAKARRAIQTRRGRWRAILPQDGNGT